MASTTPTRVALEPGHTATTDQLTMWIEDAERILRDRLGDLSSRDPMVLEYVVRKAVAAYARNPSGDSETQVQLDDGSVTRRHKSGSSEIVITDEWWRLLGAESTTRATWSFAPSEA